VQPVKAGLRLVLPDGIPDGAGNRLEVLLVRNIG